MSRQCHAAWPWRPGLGGGGHGFSFFRSETVFSWPWWNILEYFRLDHIGSHDVTHHTSIYQSYWVILSHTVISIHIRHHIKHIISHPYRSTSLAKCTIFCPFLAMPSQGYPWLRIWTWGEAQVPQEWLDADAAKEADDRSRASVWINGEIMRKS